MTLNIGNYKWELKFVPPEEIPECDGRTFYNDFRILVRNDLGRIPARLVIIHEIVHAILGTQGRVYQKEFGVEEVCEFIAWKLPEINAIMDKIDAEYYEKEK